MVMALRATRCRSGEEGNRPLAGQRCAVSGWTYSGRGMQRVPSPELQVVDPCRGERRHKSLSGRDSQSDTTIAALCGRGGSPIFQRWRHPATALFTHVQQATPDWATDPECRPEWYTGKPCRCLLPCSLVDHPIARTDNQAPVVSQGERHVLRAECG